MMHDGKTLLHVAAAEERVNTVRVLLDHKADIRAKVSSESSFQTFLAFEVRMCVQYKMCSSLYLYRMWLVNQLFILQPTCEFRTHFKIVSLHALVRLLLHTLTYVCMIQYYIF